MIRLAVAGPDTAIFSSLCASCPFSPAGCCTAPPRMDWSDVARIVAHGGRDWLLDELAAGRLVRGERWLNLKRRKRVPRDGAPRIATCAYHGDMGCTIPHDRRPATCNYYVCEEALAQGGPEGPRGRAVHAELVERFVAWDAELDRRVRASYPEGPPLDGPFLDWLAAAFDDVRLSTS